MTVSRIRSTCTTRITLAGALLGHSVAISIFLSVTSSDMVHDYDPDQQRVHDNDYTESDIHLREPRISIAPPVKLIPYYAINRAILD
jgi:hypothetical protein